jgi:hypothetical protein
MFDSHVQWIQDPDDIKAPTSGRQKETAMTGRKARTVLGAGVGLLSLTGASLAFACSTLAPTAVTAISESAGQPNDTVTVTGTNLNAMGTGPARVVIEDGAQHFLTELAPLPLVIAADKSEKGTTQVTIPKEPFGIYRINIYRGIFKATPADWEYKDPNAGRFVPTKPDYGTADTSVAGSLTAPGSDNSSAGTGQGSSPASSAARQAAAPSAAGASRSGSTIVAGSTLSPAASAAAPGSSAAPSTANAPSSKVLGDLWGNFAHGQTTSQAPSLIESTGSGIAPQLVVGLTAGALVAMLGGFVVAEVVRRRATATATVS